MSKDSLMARVQTVLNLEDKEKLEQLKELVSIQYESLESRIHNKMIPQTLEYIVVETSVARYNRLGSEGLESEGIDVINQHFIEDLFKPYQVVISQYNKQKIKKLKML